MADFFSFSHHQSKQKIYIVGETKPFRKLARELPLVNGKDDIVIEIGSSYGECLNVLAKRTGGKKNTINEYNHFSQGIMFNIFSL